MQKNCELTESNPFDLEINYFDPKEQNKEILKEIDGQETSFDFTNANSPKKEYKNEGFFTETNDEFSPKKKQPDKSFFEINTKKKKKKLNRSTFLKI